MGLGTGYQCIVVDDDDDKTNST